MAFLENTQVQEQFQVPTPQVDDPPKKKKLWDYMTKKRLYTKSYEDFDTQFSTPEKVSKLYNFLTEKKQYTKTEDDFVNQFFEDVKKKRTYTTTTEHSTTNTRNKSYRNYYSKVYNCFRSFYKWCCNPRAYEYIFTIRRKGRK